MNFDDIYGSKFLKGADLQYGKVYRLTMVNYEIGETKDRQTGQVDPQIVLHFNETKKHLGLSATNANRIAEYYSKDFQAWIGQTLYLRLENVDAFGESHDVPRVLPLKENPHFQQHQHGAGAAQAAAPAAPQNSNPGPSAPGASAEPLSSHVTTAVAPGAPDTSPPQSLEQGLHQAASEPDPFDEIGQPAIAGQTDDFDDDIPF